MKRAKFVGRYKQDVKSPCHFEDIPIFIKMAEAKKENPFLSNVVVIAVTEGTLIFTDTPIARWQIVSNLSGTKNVLAYRECIWETEPFPSIYRVKLRYYKGVPYYILKNVSCIRKDDGKNRNGFERLQIYYNYKVKHPPI